MRVRRKFWEAVYPLLVGSEGGEVEVDFSNAEYVNIVSFYQVIDAVLLANWEIELRVVD
jgi:hypothetical protein